MKNYCQIFGIILFLLFGIAGVQAQGLRLTVTNQNNNLCYGEQAGKFTVQAVGGAAPYLFSLDGGVTYRPGTNANDFTYERLGAGKYTVMVRDANRRRARISVDISEFGYLYASSRGTNVSACGAYDGQIVITANGGQPPYQYRKEQWQPWDNNNTFTNLFVGTYSFQVQDANGCIAYVYGEVAPPVYLDGRIGNITGPTFCNSNNGSISVTPPTSGSGNYRYRMNGGSYQVGTDFNNLRVGRYDIEIEDQVNGCVQQLSVLLLNDNRLSGNANIITAPECPADNTGEIQLSATGGTPPYQFSFNGSPFSNTITYSNLVKGEYGFQVRDANGCIDNGRMWVYNTGNNMRMNLTKTDADCFQNNGSVTANATGGNPPYEYSINGAPFQPNNFFDRLPNGYYNVAVRDARGCIAFKGINVTNPIRIAVDTLLVPTCFGTPGDGKIRINATGILGPFEYSIDGGRSWSNNNVFEDLGMDRFRILARDVSTSANDGCTAELNFGFEMPNGQEIWYQILSQSSADTIQPKCDGTTGKITIHARPTRYRFDYSLDGLVWTPDSVFNNLEGGIRYAPQVRIRNCQLNDSLQTMRNVPITKLSNGDSLGWEGFEFDRRMSVTFDLTPATGCGSNDGRIHVSAHGAAPFTFSLDGGAFQTDSIFTLVTSGERRIQVKDNNGCIQTFTRKIHAPSPFGLDAVAIGVTHSGATDGSVTFYLNGTAAYPARVEINGTFWRNMTSDTDSLINQPEGWYMIRIVDANGCVAEDTTYIGIDRGGFSNEVTGYIYDDANQNGTQDPGEEPISDVMIYVLSPNGDEPVRYASSDEFGFYTVSLGRGTWRIFADRPNYAVRTQPAQDFYNVTFNRSGQDLAGKDFGFYRHPDSLDVTVSVTQVGAAQRGRDVRYIVTRWNRGNKIVDGTVKFKHDRLVRPNDFFPAQDAVNGNEVTWNYSQIRPGKFHNMRITGSLDPAGVQGMNLTNTGSIDPTSGDLYLPNNNDTDRTVITAPFDPNLKLAQRLNRTKADTIWETETILYTLYFQNEGNATAKTVRVVDEFDTNYDMKTFEMVAASHEKLSLSFRGGAEDLASATPTKAVVMWTMDDYYLPAKSDDELGSIGFVKFKIKMKPKRSCDLKVENTMKIYFDYEQPVQPKAPAITVVNPSPKGDFKAEPQQVKVGEKVKITPIFAKYYNQSSWTVQDAANSNLIPKDIKPFEVSFDTPGEKKITLTLSNPFCSGQTIEQTVIVGDCSASIREDVSKEICTNDTLTLVFNEVITADKTIEWSTGEKSAKIVIKAPGTYTLKVTEIQSQCVWKEVTYNVSSKDCNILTPNVFTPNGDGQNDYWEMKSPEIERLKVTIFDRWGTKVYEADGNSARWDGGDQASGQYFYQMELTTRDGKKTQRAGSITLLK